MHVLVGADDGVDRTGLDAQRTADAMRFVDAGDQQRPRLAAGQVQRQQRRIQQAGQDDDRKRAAIESALARARARRNTPRP